MPVTARPLTLDDTELFRKFRLAALRESPTSFAGAATDEEALPFAQWQTRLSAPGSAVLGYFLDGALVGTLQPLHARLNTLFTDNSVYLKANTRTQWEFPEGFSDWIASIDATDSSSTFFRYPVTKHADRDQEKSSMKPDD